MSGARSVLNLKHLEPGRQPVVLLGGLNLLRPLGLASIPVIVATPSPASLALRSRYCRGTCMLPRADSSGGSATVEVLLAAGEELFQRTGSKTPLFYGTDDQLALLYRNRDAISRHFTAVLNEPDLGLALLDKAQFDDLARRCGLAVPRTLAWSGNDAGSIAAAEGPVVLKPRLKEAWEKSEMFRTLLGGKGKAIVFESGNALLARPEVVRLQDALTVQEFIPGGDDRLLSYHGFADEKGEVLASFFGRKIRTFPPITGESSFIELIAGDEELERAGREVIEKLGLKGIFKLDLKQSPLDGRIYLLEVNARFNLWHYLGAASGVNLPRIVYDYLVSGTREPAATYSTRGRWVDLRLDYRAFRELRACGKLSVAAWVRSLLWTGRIYHIFSWRDPWPFVVSVARHLGRKTGIWRPTEF